MSDTPYRIPKLAMAVMVFGGLGCDDDKDKHAGDLSEARFTRIARDECHLEYTCPNLMPNDDTLTEQQCVDSFVEDIKVAVAKASKACIDAYLDYYECYTGLGCDGDPVGCERKGKLVDTTCGKMLDD